MQFFFPACLYLPVSSAWLGLHVIHCSTLYSACLRLSVLCCSSFYFFPFITHFFSPTSCLSVWLNECTSLPICHLSLSLPAHLPAMPAWRVMFTGEVNELLTTNATFEVSTYISGERGIGRGWKWHKKGQERGNETQRRWREMRKRRSMTLGVSQCMPSSFRGVMSSSCLSLWRSHKDTGAHTNAHIWLNVM